LRTPLSRTFFERDPVAVAPELLGKVVVNGHLAARIVEVEAYRGEGDPASHAARGRTNRNEAMFGPAGRWYVYFTYGMHWCANLVCAPEGTAGAVLVRAASPLRGLTAMRAARSTARRDVELCQGPARLCVAMGITGDDNGADAVRGRLRVVDDGTGPPSAPLATPRIGISAGTGMLWRWVVAGDPHVSRLR